MKNTNILQRTENQILIILIAVLAFPINTIAQEEILSNKIHILKSYDQDHKIGIGAGKTIDFATLSPEVKQTMEEGIKEVWSVDFAAFMKKVEEGEITAGQLFGTREYLKNNYLYRMGAAVLGIFGNSEQEAIYPMYSTDDTRQAFDATSNKYTLHFAANELPPVNAFWSLTMYELPSSLLVANPINRYLLNSYVTRF
jgi:hypothetical protein